MKKGPAQRPCFISAKTLGVCPDTCSYARAGTSQIIRPGLAILLVFFQP